MYYRPLLFYLIWLHTPFVSFDLITRPFCFVWFEGLLLEEPIQKEDKVAERAAHFAYMLNACDLQSITVETFIIKQHDPINIIFQSKEFHSLFFFTHS